MELSHAVWRKASRSTSNGGNCVEVARIPETIAVRDSKDPHGPKLTVSHDDFRRFAETLKSL
ncbi:DUF397 domain-containing protein [Actinomadura sp. 9N215]|uniref:DUF397 domain-containing protein n=1 Tax=Actinomadura sp. 9N215 TaxID=3375150 RepID=UPI0037BA59A2